MEERKYKRIIVLGSTGSGKTVLSNSISKRTGIPVVHLDKEYWLPNWGRPTQDEWIEKLSTLVNNEEWIMDGNYIESLDERLKQADLVIVLDIEKKQCGQIIILTDGNEVPEEVKGLARYKDLQIEIMTDRDLDKDIFKLIEVK